jgi:tRNA A-37 threonylcarbamoyl transferase component Bud32
LTPRFLGFIDADAIAIEFVEGQPISRLAPKPAARAARQLSRALRCLHASGMYHLDLRSGGNIPSRPRGTYD